MEIEAPISPYWRKQKFFLVALLLGVGCWFLYDGWIDYPKKNVQFQAHQQLEREQRLDEWSELAKSRGWPQEPPHRLFTSADMTAQLVIGAIAVTVGLITAGWLCRTLRTRLRSNGETLWDTRGRAIPFTMINGVEKKRWESKGLADVFYEANGRHGKVRFDDYKYAGCEKIFAEIEQHLASRAPGADGGGDKSGAG